MTARKYLKRLGGFTLVELLIVIAILAIIALIVIAAINPIEQANRARDTGMKADGSQLVSAIDRYFTARFEFPWVAQDPVTYGNDDTFGFFSAGNYLIGICLLDDCVDNGVLISTDELKPEFKNRNFIDGHIEGTNGTVFNQDMLMVGKDAGSSSSVYVCFVPLSKSNRTRACAEGLVYQVANDGSRTGPVDQATCDAIPNDGWAVDFFTSYYICVPE